MALLQPSLLRKGNRGLLLEKARKKVADEGYSFKKGVSRSKVYGNVGTNSSKRSKINQDVRENRLKEVQEDLTDLNAHIAFKEKRLSQAESLKDYKLCDRITEEIIECKSRKRELENELRLLNKKDRKAKKRVEALQSKLIRSSTPVSSSIGSSSAISISPPVSSNCSTQSAFSLSPPSIVSPPSTSIIGHSDKESSLHTCSYSDGDSLSSENDSAEQKTTNSHF